ncbi:bifunctional methylenetetrahydrofolate dehydrogenase/methenyltetrahydrofolate cyclohydrolase FolD [bacterium]|nr:bifunctional methylenetetrahydrofolate dehydrogenase/methenyltetrahydrofolate cyclohydrolase FolD [bacterium]
MAQIIDGKKIAKEIREEVAEAILKFKDNNPALTVILVGDDPASHVYVRNKARACEKAGVISHTIQLDEDIEQCVLLEKIEELNNDTSIHGILVQLPLPDHIDETTVLEAILPEKDVDGFHPINVGKVVTGDTSGFIPATPAGIIQLLHRSGHSSQGKHVVVVGRSNIVGKPIGMLLLQKNQLGNATVTYCHSRTHNLADFTRQADILIAAIGRPEMITGDMVKDGVIIIDVGTNRVIDENTVKGYRLAGDVDYVSVFPKAKAITPVPGGVGPMTIAMLLKNTLKAFKLLTA